MKTSKWVIPIVSGLLGLCLVLLTWNPVIDSVAVLVQGQDPSFDLGDNYEMWGAARTIIYWRSRENSEWERIIHPEATLEFALEGRWIIGRTENGWFSINKDTHDCYYPLLSVSDVGAITGLDISSLNMETDPTPYLILRADAIAAKKKANRLYWLLLFAVPLIFALGPYAWIHVLRHLKSRGTT